MKKLLLVAALGVAGLVSAKDVKSEIADVKNEVVKNENAKEVSKEQSKVILRDIAWIGVSTWCGKVFYLNANDYSSFEELDAAAGQFTQQQCAGASSQIVQFT